MFDQVACQNAVALALAEDIGTGDVTSALVDEDHQAVATVITREPMRLCGQPWVEATVAQYDEGIQLHWYTAEGSDVDSGEAILMMRGRARSLLTVERCCLNWLQCLSGTATQVARCVEQLKGSSTVLLDTRKTLPGLRAAQKYAVAIGGGRNHRHGLYDAYLIKENHILSGQSIGQIVLQARTRNPNLLCEIEVESREEFQQAKQAGVDVIMCDNFSLEDLRWAVGQADGQVKIEVSGNVSLEQLGVLANIGVDYISMGALTKHVQAIDLSMRFEAVLGEE